MKPINHNVFIKKIEKQTSTGLVLSDATKYKPSMGEVVYINKDLESQLKPGDKIYYDTGTEQDLDFDDENLSVVSFNNIISKV